MRSRFSRPRGGFTIIELLVAAGVSVLLMVIITEAFKRGIDMFRTMRAQGVMQERLRTGATAIRDDLAAHHFPERQNTGNITQYVSIQTKDDWAPPTDGFFRIYQGPMDSNNNPFVFEGTDSDGMLSVRATTHILHFTVLRKGTSADNMFRTLATPRVLNNPGPPAPNPPATASFPADFTDPPDYASNTVFSSRWAEVAYFLVPNGDTANGTPLFNLCRRQKLLVPAPLPPLIPWYGADPASPLNNIPADAPPNAEISTRQELPSGLYFYNRTGDVTQPRFRFGMLPATTNAADPRTAGLLIDSYYDPTVTATHIVTPRPIPAGYTGLIWHGYPPLQEFAPYGYGPTDPRAGDDIILADVISFEAKCTWDVTPVVAPELPDQPPQSQYNIPGVGLVTNTDYPFDILPNSQRNPVFASQNIRVFDTWSATPGTQYANWRTAGSSASIPLRIRPKAVLIRIRIWDAKAEQTRQLTIIQDI